MKLLGIILGAWLLLAGPALAQSTVNPNVPATNSALSSSPIRGNFSAAASDINGILGMHAVASLGACSTQTQTVGADCLVTSSPSAYQWYKYSGTTNGYVLIGTINPSVSPPTFSSGLAPIGNGQLIANCTGATAIPSGCSWSAFADQAIGAVNGNLPYRSGGSWGTIFTGVTGHTLPLLDGTGVVFTNPVTSGVAGSVNGGFCLANTTSGSICLNPTTGVLGSSVATLPANTGQIAELNLSQNWSATQQFNGGASVANLTATSSFTATGLVTNADLVSPSITVNGTTCTLGGSCTPTATASSITTGTTTVTGGPGVLFNATSGGALQSSTTLPSGISATNTTLTTPSIVSGTPTGAGVMGYSSNTITFGDGTSNHLVSSLDQTQTLSNKTLSSPALSGIVTGNATFSGGITHSGQAIFSATTLGTITAGNTVVAGTFTSPPTLVAGEGAIYTLSTGGLVVQGGGSVDDFRLYNKSGSLVLNVPTGATAPQLPGLASGTCANGLALDSSNNVVKSSCAGAATSIQVTGTTVTSATSNTLLGPGTVTAGSGTLSAVSAGPGITITASTINVSLASAITDQSPSNPTGTTSSTPVMMGLGKDQAGGGAHSCTITPVVSTRVRFAIDATISNSSASTTGLRASFGTGTAPSNGVAQTGTGIGNVLAFTSTAAGAQGAVHIEGVASGLSIGTAYWFDAALNVGGGTGTLTTLHCVATEKM